MRAEFEVYRKDVEVVTKTGKRSYKLLPLNGRFFPKLMGVVAKFPQIEENKDATDEEKKENNEKFINALDEESVAKLHTLIFETLKYSLVVKDTKELEELDLFVSQNLFAFIPALIEVNFGSDNKE